MKVETARLLEHIHGHLGWLAAANLFHPAWLLRRPGRRAVAVTSSATLLATLAGALGGILYVEYSRVLKRPMYVASVKMGLMFERKEHLAFAAIALAWAGLVAHLTARQNPLRGQIAHRCYVGAAVLALLVAALGTWIASFKTF